MNKEISKKIKAYRDEHDLSQAEFGKLCYVQRAAVSKWEKGQVTNMTPQSLFAVSDLIGVDPREFYFDNWENKYNNTNKLVTESNILDSVKSVYGKEASDLLIDYIQLNDLGKKKLIENASDLISMSKYTFQEKGDEKRAL